MDRALRVYAPLILVGLALLIWFESYLPGAAWVDANLGETVVLRFAAGMMAVYLALLLAERQRMDFLFKNVLGELKAFRNQLGSGPGPSAGKVLDDAQREDVLQILVAALASPESSARRAAAEHLARLTGQSFGEDAAAWRAWLERR